MRLGEPLAVLVHERMPVPGQIGRRFAGAGGRVEIGRHAFRRLRRAQQPAVVGLADRDVAGREVRDDRRSRQRRQRARGQRHPQVLAELEVQHEARDVGRREQQPAAERHVLPEQPYRRRQRLGGRRELALLVELAVVGQVGLRHRAENPSAVHHDSAVEQSVLSPQRQPGHQHQRQRAARVHQPGEGGERRIQQRVLLEEILVRVGRQAELREHREDGPLRRGLPGEHERLREVVGRRGHFHPWSRDRHPHEPVPVDGVEGRLGRGPAGLGHAGLGLVRPGEFRLTGQARQAL